MSPTPVKTFKPKGIRELVGILESHRIPIEKYGIGPSLPLQALLDQILDGRVVLKEQSGKLVRLLGIASVNIYYQNGNHLFHLYEDHQARIDPETRQDIPNQNTRRKLRWSIARKMLPEDTAQEKALMALQSELGLDIPPSRLFNEHFYVFYRESTKFPQMKNHVRVTEYDLFLNPEEYKSEGYVYEDKYLRSYFRWRKVKEGVEYTR